MNLAQLNKIKSFRTLNNPQKKIKKNKKVMTIAQKNKNNWKNNNNKNPQPINLMTSKKLKKTSIKIIVMLHKKFNLKAKNNLKNKFSNNSLRNLFRFKQILINYLKMKLNLILMLYKYKEAQVRKTRPLHPFHYLNNQNQKNKRVPIFYQLKHLCNRSLEIS